MVFLTLNGRCGNQLFQYAVARAVMEKCKDDELVVNTNFIDAQNIKLDLNGFDVHHFELESEPVHKIILKQGNIVQYLLCGFNSFLFMRIKSWKLYRKLEKILYPVLSFFGIYYNMSNSYVKIHKSVFKNKFIIGYWESKISFNEIRTSLLEEIHAKNVSSSTKETIVEMRVNESVCVSVRRGDFLDDNNAKEYSVCKRQYFEDAIRKMHQLKPNSTFFFFSNEIEWVKDNISIPHGCKAYYESGKDPIPEVIEMMRNCKNFIMSNSTFSWWAWYLSDAIDNKDSVVISPDRWRNVERLHYHLLEDEWIKIEIMQPVK